MGRPNCGSRDSYRMNSSQHYVRSVNSVTVYSVISYVEMPRVRYTLEQRLYMYDTYMRSGSTRKVRIRFRSKFQDVTVPHRRTIHRVVNKVVQTGSLLDSRNRNVECLLKRNWMKSVLGLKKHSNALHRRPGFQNRQHELPQNSCV